MPEIKDSKKQKDFHSSSLSQKGYFYELKGGGVYIFLDRVLVYCISKHVEAEQGQSKLILELERSN